VTDSFSVSSFSGSETVGAYAHHAAPPPNVGSAFAQASADISLLLDSTGPERDGFLQITWNVGETGRLATGGSALVIGALSLTAPSSSVSYVCCASLVPVTLGQALQFDLNAESSQEVAGFGNTGMGTATSTLELQFFEADGVTNVPISETSVPEPASLSLLGIGLFSTIAAAACWSTKAFKKQIDLRANLGIRQRGVELFDIGTLREKLAAGK
jgi:hypothetical protein